MCLNHISIFCRHSSYCITYTVASFVNMFSLLLRRTEANQQLICRLRATRAACAYDYPRVQIRTDGGRHTEQTANPTQRTSVALPPFEVAQGLLSSLGVAQTSREWGGGREKGWGTAAEPSRSLPRWSLARKRRCVAQERVEGAIAPCGCLQLHSAKRCWVDLGLGKNRGENICGHVLARDSVGTGVWFRTS